MNREFDQGELKDRLPDLVQGSLPDSDRMAVEAAVQADAGLARELELVRAARRALTPPASGIDTARIVAAVGRRKARQGWRNSAMLRIAAVGILAVGLGSIALVQRTLHTSVSDRPGVPSESALVASNQLSISFGYDVSDLPAADFEKLVADLEKSGGVPSAEPRKTVIAPTGDDSQ